MVAQNTDNLSGKRIDKYQIEQLLTPHKESALYLARDVQSDTEVFLELVNPIPAQDREFNQAFQQNMHKVQSLAHPNIPAIQYVGQTKDKRPYAVINYVAGSSLADKVSEWNREGKQLSVVKALELIKQVASALNVAHHADLIHHDLRPQNIILREDNTPVLVDLGLPIYSTEPEAHAWDPAKTNTIDYASPEQLEGKEITPRSNIYSLGIILYELLAGHAPKLPAASWDIFERGAIPKEVPLEEARIGLASETYRLVRNCLWRQEWSRYDNTHELIAAIDTAITAERALPQSTAVPAAPRRWLPIAIPVALVLFIVVGFVIGGSGPNNNDPNALIQGTTVVPTQPPTATATATIPPTRTPVPIIIPPTETPTVSTIIELLEPLPNSQFNQEDMITFDWRWATALSPGQQFAIYLVSGTEVSLISTVKEPILGATYRLRVPALELKATQENSEWQVILETVATGESVFLSELRPIKLNLTPATPGATLTPTPGPTIDCVPKLPPGWIIYSIKRGDSLFNLAIAGGANPDRVYQANCLTSSSILSVGQQVYIPRPPATNTPTPAPATPTPPPSGGGGGGSKPTPGPTPENTPPP